MIRTEVEGIPAFWTPGSHPPHAQREIGLSFRVGRADETLARGGITHLVEHLVLHRLGLSDYHYNGTTGHTVTTFYTRGDDAEAVEFLNTVCQSLADLPIERLGTEKSILRTEASGRRTSVNEPLVVWRYGPRTYGLPAFEEYGLNDLTAENLRWWVATCFTRGNAALWCTGGAPPEGLSLTLPDGPLLPVPAPTMALPRTPAYFTGSLDGVCFDAVVPRSAAAVAYVAVLNRRLRTILRHDLGLSYTAGAVYEPRDGTHAVVTALADALPDKAGEVVGPFIDILLDLVAGEIGPEDLKAVRVAADDRSAHDPTGRQFAQSHAVDHLWGRDAAVPNELVADLAGVGPDGIREVARVCLESALVMVPRGSAVGRGGFTAAPTASADEVEGADYWPVHDPEQRNKLRIGPHGVTRIRGPHRMTVRYAECAGMLAYPDGARVLFAPDAVTVEIEPRLWRVPPEVLAGIDAAVPAHQVVHMPARDPESIPAAPDTHETVAVPAAQRSRFRPGLDYAVVILFLVAFAGVVVAVDGSPFAVFAGCVFAAVAIRSIHRNASRQGRA